MLSHTERGVGAVFADPNPLRATPRSAGPDVQGEFGHCSRRGGVLLSVERQRLLSRRGKLGPQLRIVGG